MSNDLIKTISESNKELLRKLEDTLSEHDSALRFNLHQVVRHFLWKLCLEYDDNKEYSKERTRKGGSLIYMAGDLDKIIDTVIETSCYTNRSDHEDYPIWDEKSVKDEIERVMKVLVKSGVALP